MKDFVFQLFSIDFLLSTPYLRLFGVFLLGSFLVLIVNMFSLIFLSVVDTFGLIKKISIGYPLNFFIPVRVLLFEKMKKEV